MFQEIFKDGLKRLVAAAKQKTKAILHLEK
jgi:hypothetical protein